MPLDPEKVRNLLYKQETKTLAKPPNKRQQEIDNIKLKHKRPKRLIRIQTQHPSLPRGGPVGRNQTAIACQTHGCGLPTWINYNGIPYCNHCMIHTLSIRIAELTWRLESDGNNGNGTDTDTTDYF